MRWRTLYSLIVMALLSYAIWGHYNKANAQDVKEVAAAQIESQIWEARKEQCLTPLGTRLREILADRVNKLLGQYTAAAGKPYNLPNCSEFGGVG